MLIRLKCFLMLLALCDFAFSAEPIKPTKVLRPFEEDGMENFTQWLKKTGRDDPQQVFRLEKGVLRCGDEDHGYVATKETYRDYHLHVEYRWGRRNESYETVRNAGVLLHGVGPD